MNNNVLKLDSLKRAEIALTKRGGVILKCHKKTIGEGDSLLTVDDGYLKLESFDGFVYAGLCLTKTEDFVCIIGITYDNNAEGYDYDYIISVNKIQEIDSAFCPNQHVERYILSWEGVTSEFVSSYVADNITIRI